MRTIPIALLVLLAGCGGSAPPPADDTLPADPAPEAVVSAEELGQTPADAAPAPAEPVRPGARTPSRPATQPSQLSQPAAGEPAPDPEPEVPAAPAPPTAAIGTDLTVTTGSEITSRTNKAGELVSATVVADVTDAAGRVVIPAGSAVSLRILEIKEAENQGGQGTLVLAPVSVTVDGTRHDLRADVTSLQTEMRGRGVTAGDAGKVAAGAAAGAVLGQILGKKRSSTVVGGVAGAAVGTAVAIKTADQDIVVPAGSRIGLRLTAEVVRAGS